jgi:hypothetical protein
METITISVVRKTNEETTTMTVEYPYTGELEDLTKFIYETHFMTYRLGFSEKTVEEAFQNIKL